MPHGSGYVRCAATVAALLALAPATTAASAASAAAAPRSTVALAAVTTDPAFVTVTDGCGRVDSLSVSTKGTYYVQVMPDGKAAKRNGTAPVLTGDDAVADPESALAAYYGYVPITQDWQRSIDESKAFVSVRVLEWNDDMQSFTYLPQILEGSGVQVIKGTEQSKLTNEDCAQPEEPTFTDEEGSADDTVTIPTVLGVKYSGKPGVNPGKGTMTITATADKGFRLADEDGVPLPADETRWTHVFNGTTQVGVPAGKQPVFRTGGMLPAAKGKPAVCGPNLVVLRYVPGIAWVVDGKQVKVTDKQTIVEVPVDAKTSVEVEAVSADPKAYAISGTTEWVVGASAAAKPKLPRVVAPTTGVTLGKSTVTWSPASGFPATARHNVRYRVITLTKNGVRAAAPWRAWKQEFSSRSAVLAAKPGTLVEVQAQSVTGRAVSGWSAPTPVYFPLDVKAGGKKPFWATKMEKGALGNSMLTASQRTSAWTVRTPTTNRVAIWFGTAPTGAPAAVFVDGKRVATIQTKASKVRNRQMLKTIPVRWDSHVVAVVHAGKNGQTLRVDGVAYGR